MSADLRNSIISSLLPILITLLFAWLSNRNDQVKRRQILEDAKQRIELISAYVASQNLVLIDTQEIETIKKTAASELYDIKSYLGHRLQSLEKSAERSDNFFQRFFLLYGMKSWLASLLRASFYFVLLLSVLFTILISSSSFTTASIEEFGLAFNILMVTIASIPGILFAMLLRWLAIRSDKSPSAAGMEGSLQ